MHTYIYDFTNYQGWVFHTAVCPVRTNIKIYYILYVFILSDLWPGRRNSFQKTGRSLVKYVGVGEIHKRENTLKHWPGNRTAASQSAFRGLPAKHIAIKDLHRSDRPPPTEWFRPEWTESLGPTANRTTRVLMVPPEIRTYCWMSITYMKSKWTESNYYYYSMKISQHNNIYSTRI